MAGFFFPYAGEGQGEGRKGEESYSAKNNILHFIEKHIVQLGLKHGPNFSKLCSSRTEGFG